MKARELALRSLGSPSRAHREPARRRGNASGDAANRGFADVDTKPMPELRTFPASHVQAGRGSCHAPDGSVYLGTQEGKLIARMRTENNSGAGGDQGESIVA